MGLSRYLISFGYLKPQGFVYKQPRARSPQKAPGNQSTTLGGCQEAYDMDLENMRSNGNG